MVLGWRRSFLLGVKSFMIGLLLALALFLIELMTKQLTLLKFRITDFSNSLFLLSPSPFASFDPNRRKIIFPFSQLGLTIGLDIMNLFFMFLVSSGYLTPIVKYSVAETNCKMSWMRALKIATKSAIPGVLIVIIFLGIPLACYHPPPFSFSPSSLLYPQTILIGFLGALVFLTTFYAAIQIPIRIFIVKLTSSEFHETASTSWRRSFLVSLKSSALGWLWSMPFVLCALIISGLTLTYMASLERLDAYIIGIIFADFVIYVFSILMQIPTIALSVKYLHQELEKS